MSYIYICVCVCVCVCINYNVVSHMKEKYTKC